MSHSSHLPEALPGHPQIARHGATLMIESLPAVELARRFGTPLYVYSRAAIEQSARAYGDAVQGRPVALRYAVKANSSLAILQVLARLGWGFDVVSGGELARVLAAGASASSVVFSGVGKTDTEIAAALRAGVQCLNVESLSELQRVNRVAGEVGVAAPVSLRINPDVDPRTHPYISTGLRNNKVGIAQSQARDGGHSRRYDVVGPVCESGDWLGRDRLLDLREDDVLAILSAGAYGMALASNYNTRGRAAEVLVDGEQAHLIRERENLDDLLRGERMLAP